MSTVADGHEFPRVKAEESRQKEAFLTAIAPTEQSEANDAAGNRWHVHEPFAGIRARGGQLGGDS